MVQTSYTLLLEAVAGHNHQLIVHIPGHADLHSSAQRHKFVARDTRQKTEYSNIVPVLHVADLDGCSLAVEARSSPVGSLAVVDHNFHRDRLDGLGMRECFEELAGSPSQGRANNWDLVAGSNMTSHAGRSLAWKD